MMNMEKLTICLQRLVVCLEESLYIHNIRDMKVLHTIRDTPPNPKGICALSPNNDHAYLAYPGSVQAGEVQIFDTITLVSGSVVFDVQGLPIRKALGHLSMRLYSLLLFMEK